MKARIIVCITMVLAGLWLVYASGNAQTVVRAEESIKIASKVGLKVKVVGVSDGDTIKVLAEGKTERVRLHGIDCPEKGQPFGNKAKKFTASKCFGKEVIMLRRGPDKYGRTVANIFLLEEKGMKPLNEELVRAGYAWWYQKYAPDDKELQKLEQEAKAAKRGLWADPHPVPPWEWRKQKRIKQRSKIKPGYERLGQDGWKTDTKKFLDGKSDRLDGHDAKPYDADEIQMIGK